MKWITMNSAAAKYGSPVLVCTEGDEDSVEVAWWDPGTYTTWSEHLGRAVTRRGFWNYEARFKGGEEIRPTHYARIAPVPAMRFLICGACEKSFVVRAYQVRYCSSRCRHTAQKRRYRARMRAAA